MNAPIQGTAGRGLALLTAGTMAVLALSSCGYLSITDRCYRSYPKGTEGYRECVRREQAEAERVRERAARQFPTPNLP